MEFTHGGFVLVLVRFHTTCTVCWFFDPTLVSPATCSIITFPSFDAFCFLSSHAFELEDGVMCVNYFQP